MNLVEYRSRLVILSVLFALPTLSSAVANHPSSSAFADTSSFVSLAKQCAPGVHPALLGRVATVESSGNPFAIGVVAGHLAYQPKTLKAALATVQALAAGGWNYSMGLIQVNVHNLARFGKTTQAIFDPCTNLKTGAAILSECYERARASRLQGDGAVRAALSCYYTGDLERGGAYALKVAAATPVADMQGVQPIDGIPDVIPDVSTRSGASGKSNVASRRGAQRAETPKSDDKHDWFTTYGDEDADSGYHHLPSTSELNNGDSNEK